MVVYIQPFLLFVAMILFKRYMMALKELKNTQDNS